MSDLKRIQVGERLDGIPADTWNAFVDAVGRNRPEPRLVARKGGGSAPMIVNDTGTAIDAAFGVLCIDAPINDPGTATSEPYQGIRLMGIAPTQELIDAGKWCILQAPAADQAAVPYKDAGDCWVKVDVTDEAHTHAQPEAGTVNNLVSSPGNGARILWKESGAGVKWAVVRLGGGGSDIVTVLITATVAAADWDVETSTLTPTEFTATRLVNNQPDASMDCTSEYVTQIDVGTGKAKIGHVTADGRLLNVDCTEITYGT